MLKPEYLEHVPDSMVELYSQAELDILQNMAERIKKYDYYIPAAEWQAKKLNAMGMMYDDIQKRISLMTGKSEEELQRLMIEAGIKTLAVDDARHKLAGHKVLPLQASPSLMQVINANYQKTQKAFRNLTKTTAANGAKQFADALDLTHMQIISGAFDTEAAIRNALKSLSEKGVASVRYPSGRIDSIETAVRRATITGVNQTASELQLARAEDVGCNLVETTAHAGARPEHAEWQGKVFMLKGSSEKYPNFYEATGYGTGAGLCGWNCRHNFYPYYEGVSEPAYTEDMLKGYEAKNIEIDGKKYTEYEAQQMQRKLERKIRALKREHACGIDRSLAIKETKNRYNSLLEQSGLQHNANLLSIGGRKRFINNIDKLSAITGFDLDEYIRGKYNIRVTGPFNIDDNMTELLDATIGETLKTFPKLKNRGIFEGIIFSLEDLGGFAGYHSQAGKLYLRYGTKVADIERFAKTNARAGILNVATADGILYHEYGHAIEKAYLFGNTAKQQAIDRLYTETKVSILGENYKYVTVDSKEIYDAIPQEVIERVKHSGTSYYGLQDSSEFVAEAVSQYLSHDESSGITRKIMSIILGE